MSRALDWERARRSGPPKHPRALGRISQPPTERQRRYLAYLAARLGIAPPAVTTRRAASGRIELLERKLGIRSQPPASR